MSPEPPLSHPASARPVAQTSWVANHHSRRDEQWRASVPETLHLPSIIKEDPQCIALVVQRCSLKPPASISTFALRDQILTGLPARRAISVTVHLAIP